MWLNEFFIAFVLLGLPLVLGLIRNWFGPVLLALVLLMLYVGVCIVLNNTEMSKEQAKKMEKENAIESAIDVFKKNKIDSLTYQLQAQKPYTDREEIIVFAEQQIGKDYTRRRIEGILKTEQPYLFENAELNLFERASNFRFSHFLMTILLITVLGALLAYSIEYYVRNQSVTQNEYFVDGRLFYKYGEYVDSGIIPIGVKESHQNYNDMGGLISKLYEEIATDLDKKFVGDESYHKDELIVADAGRKKDSRRFIKLSFSTMRNTTLTCLISVSKVGKQVTIKNFHFIRYRIRWTGILTFIVTAPLHYWFWIYHWIRGNASIEGTLGMNFYNNAFDLLDIEAYLKASNFSIMWSIEDFAKNNELYTDELKQIITNNINNTQNITIKRSKGINIGRIKLSSSQPK